VDSHLPRANKSAQMDPFRELDDRFQEIFARTTRPSLQVPQINLSCNEDTTEYRVRATLPGVRPQDIVVRINSSRVLIGVELKQPGDDRSARKVTCSRALTLAHEIEPLRATVNYQDGRVDLRLPKRTATPPEVHEAAASER
jgi:HSP20 family protein